MEEIILVDNQVLENQIYDAYDIAYDKEVFITVKGDNVVIKKCRFDNFKKDMKRLLSIEGKNCRIENCVFNQLTNNYPVIVLERKDRLDIPDNLVIIKCLFFNINKPKQNGNELIRLGCSNSSLTGNSNCSIIKNRFENYIGDIDIISVNCNNNIIANNKFINCQSTITLRHGNGTIIANNTIDGKYNKECGGVRISGEGHLILYNSFNNLLGNGTTRCGVSLNNGNISNGYYPVSLCSIAENEFVNCKCALALGYAIKGNTIKPNDIIIQDNNFNKVENIFSTNKEITGVRNGLAKNNKFMVSGMGRNLNFINDEFKYSTILTFDRTEKKKFTNYNDYKDYLLTEPEGLHALTEESSDNECVDIDEDNYENNVLKNIMKTFELSYKMRRFEELKILILKNQTEMEQLMNEMSFIFKH